MTTHPKTAAAIVASMGAAGGRLDHMDACEAGAGNISVSIKETPEDLRDFFPLAEAIELPVVVPGLAGWTVFVTGSGCRLRDRGGRGWEDRNLVHPAIQSVYPPDL